MCAAGITALLKKMDYKDTTIAVDGSLFRHHPHFQILLGCRPRLFWVGLRRSKRRAAC